MSRSWTKALGHLMAFNTELVVIVLLSYKLGQWLDKEFSLSSLSWQIVLLPLALLLITIVTIRFVKALSQSNHRNK